MVARISLCADSTASFPSVPVAVLGKWWLVTHYKSGGMTGSTVERNQKRQEKLDQTISRYFGAIVESWQFMPLFGYGFSRYPWGIDTTVELVVTRIISPNVILCPFSFLGQSLRISHVRHIFYTSFAAWGKPTQAVIRTLADLPVGDQGHGTRPAPKE